jgi:hypothetical protein
MSAELEERVAELEEQLELERTLRQELERVVFSFVGDIRRAVTHVRRHDHA